MKKTILISIISLTSMGALYGCSNNVEIKNSTKSATTAMVETTTAAPVPSTTGEAILKLKDVNQHVVKYTEYNEHTDPNYLLGRPHCYYSKTNFLDDRVDTELSSEYRSLDDGTIEFFNSEEDCDKRCDHFVTVFKSSLLIDVHQYIFKYNKAIFRVTYRLTPAEAEEYKHQMDSILNETSKNVEW